MDSRRCSKCKHPKPIEDFALRSGRPGRISWCTACVVARRKERAEDPARNRTLTMFTPEQSAASELLRRWIVPNVVRGPPVAILSPII